MLTDQQQNLLKEIQNGIEISSRPFFSIAQSLSTNEENIVAQIQTMIESGVIKRFGLVVKHHEVGFTHNAMVVWDIHDSEVSKAADLFLKHHFVTLCYRRPRRPPKWNYNLFCMIHGNDKHTVIEQIERLKMVLATTQIKFKNDILFSTKKHKQTAANYFLKLEDLDLMILNEFQNGIPISNRPFMEFAEKNKISEHEVAFRIERLKRDGYLSRFGPMYNIDKGGGQFVLCALEVPEQRYKRVTEIVNSFSEVAHNYKRDHKLNMWFVIGVENKSQVERVIRDIEIATELKVFSFPKLKEFYVDLRFKV